ncbi:DUF58 domain-containing protein [Agromyces sp. LHK192]|uniref:DUF58 domain-containing protein n=1 Tax=Agromyces sp. LHK192 TaxID=2498704 RepID=UPI000FD914AC|nr:DUF58 domain-containing protein [Agromyces sp. LHK192]
MPRPRARRNTALPRLTRRGTALVATGVVLLAVALWYDFRDVMLLAFVGIVLPLVSMGFLAIGVPRLEVQRTFTPPVVGAGGVTRVVLTVRNLATRALDGATWHDAAPAGLTRPVPGVLPALGPHERALPRGDDTARLEYPLRTTQRGVFDIGPMGVTTTDPFGLAVVTRDAGTSHELVVTPRVIALDPALDTGVAVEGVLHRLQRRTHSNADEFIAREYRHGDPLRRVHWPATARRGELMVRDEEQRGDPEARVILDTTLSGRHDRAFARSGDDPRHAGFELAVEIAASVAVHLLGRGFRVSVDPLEDPVRGALSDSAPDGYRMPGGDRLLLEDLARLETPLGSRPHHDGAIVSAGSGDARMPGYAVLVDPDAAEAQQLAALRASFSPAIAFAVSGIPPRIVDVLEEADWRVVHVRRAADLPAAWAQATATRVDLDEPGPAPGPGFDRAADGVAGIPGGDRAY